MPMRAAQVNAPIRLLQKLQAGCADLSRQKNGKNALNSVKSSKSRLEYRGHQRLLSRPNGPDCQGYGLQNFGARLEGEEPVNSFEWNKIIAGVIASALLIMVISTVSGSLMSSGEEHGEKAKLAYAIEVASDEGAQKTEEKKEVPLPVLLANADIKKGERQFAKCKSCHTDDAGKQDRTGPHLYGVLGRDVASVAGFKYSADLQAVGGTWTFEKIDHWLTNPKAMAKGTAMSFAGIKKADKRADLIAYLNTMSDSPLPLPKVEEAPAADAAAAATEGKSE